MEVSQNLNPRVLLNIVYEGVLLGIDLYLPLLVMHHLPGYGFATVDYGSDLLVPPPLLLPLMAIGMYPDGILVL